MFKVVCGVSFEKTWRKVDFPYEKSTFHTTIWNFINFCTCFFDKNQLLVTKFNFPSVGVDFSQSCYAHGGKNQLLTMLCWYEVCPRRKLNFSFEKSTFHDTMVKCVKFLHWSLKQKSTFGPKIRFSKHQKSDFHVPKHKSTFGTKDRLLGCQNSTFETKTRLLSLTFEWRLVCD